MARYDRVCASGPEGQVPNIPDWKYEFCIECSKLPYVALKERSKDDPRVLEKLYHIYEGEAPYHPWCMGEDFGNFLDLERSLQWRQELTEHRLEKWRRAEAEGRIGPAHWPEHDCGSVANNYEICLKCVELLRELMGHAEFNKTFEQASFGYSMPYNCALKLNSFVPSSMQQWISPVRIQVLIRPGVEVHDTVYVPGTFCDSCQDFYKNQEWYLCRVGNRGIPRSEEFKYAHSRLGDITAEEEL